MIYLVESNNKEKRKQRGVRFPISLLGKIEDVMKSEKSDNFSAIGTPILIQITWYNCGTMGINARVGFSP